MNNVVVTAVLRKKLKNVQQIQATGGAFAAILGLSSHGAVRMTVMVTAVPCKIS